MSLRFVYEYICMITLFDMINLNLELLSHLTGVKGKHLRVFCASATDELNV